MNSDIKTAKHTPGPWTVEQAPGGYYANKRTVRAHVYSHDGVTDGRDHIAGISCETSDAAAANARLIAAAPELLEACEIALSTMDHYVRNEVGYESGKSVLRGAIRKAKGEL